LPNVSIYLKEQIYRAALREAEEKGLSVSALIKDKVESLYEQKTLRAERTPIRPRIRK